MSRRVTAPGELAAEVSRGGGLLSRRDAELPGRLAVPATGNLCVGVRQARASGSPEDRANASGAVSSACVQSAWFSLSRGSRFSQ